MYGLELTENELPELARDIHTFTTGKSNSGVNVHRFAKRLEEQSVKLFWRLGDNIGHAAVLFTSYNAMGQGGLLI